MNINIKSSKKNIITEAQNVKTKYKLYKRTSFINGQFYQIRKVMDQRMSLESFI
jgi:hypothetical protein